MVLTTRTRTAFFVPTSTSTRPETLIRLPLSVVPKYEERSTLTGQVERKSDKPLHRTNLWTSEEHERFLQGLELFPNGPWREVAAIVGTKTTRQTMTHAQKYRQKIERRMREKPAVTEKKTRRRPRRKLEPVQQCAVSSINSVMDSISKTGPSAGIHPDSTGVPIGAVTSPVEIWSDIFDAAFFEHEFDALISSLGPPPSSAMPFEVDDGLSQFGAWV